ncbi:MAG TPA: hypothetical protein DCS21_01245 [Gammaproteobacteria bacterium]|nr:hypothetical protein [Gammaproteobacteria bacterium]
MAKDISALFNKAVDQFRKEKDRQQTGQERVLTALERDFERVKDEVCKIKPQIEAHPRVNYFWVFNDKIQIDFRTGPNRPTIQLTIQLYHPGNNRYKKGMFGYQADGYETALASVDEAVEFIAIQCGKLLA